MNTINQSKTIEIKRSQINFAPYNPKNHSKEAIKKQAENFKKVAYLGGIAWNELTGNLISGHKRVMAFDLIMKYDGSKEKDYTLKVEAISLTEKQEKEQNIFMDARATNTPQDYKLLSELISDIDYELAGLEIEDLKMIEFEVPDFEFGDNTQIETDIKETQEALDKKIAGIKEYKKEMRNNVKNMREEVFNEHDTYVILSFDNWSNKSEFMERFGYNNSLNKIKGEIFSDKIERID